MKTQMKRKVNKDFRNLINLNFWIYLSGSALFGITYAITNKPEYLIFAGLLLIYSELKNMRLDYLE